MQPFVYVLVFVAVFFAAEGIFQLGAGRRSARQASAARRLRTLADRLKAPRREDGATLLRAEGGPRRPFFKRIYDLIPGQRTLQLQLYRAGVAMPPQRFVVICAGIGAAGVIVGSFVFPNPGLAVLLGLTGLLPWMQVNRMARKRMQRFEEQFPEALELLTRALRAGHSLLFAFQLIGEEMPDPIGPEFGQLAEELKLGQELRTALENLAYRTEVGDLPFFSTAVLVQRETGGNLAELLDSLGYVIRDRFKLFGKVRSLTAVGKATANILGVWPLIMLSGLMLVGADFVSMLWKTPTGNILAIIGIVLVATGYVLCRRAAVIRV